MKLMLHHPFRRIEDLLEYDGHTFPSFAAAYEHCSLLHTHPFDAFSDELNDDDEDPFQLPEETTSDEPSSGWETLAAQRPGRDGD